MSLEMSWGVVDFRRESVPKSGGCDAEGSVNKDL